MTTTEKIEGRLEFLSWGHAPWRVIGEPRDGDLWALFWGFAQIHKGEAFRMEETFDSFALVPEPDGRFVISFDNVGSGILLDFTGGFGFSNLRIYLEGAMMRLNGRMISATVDESSFRIAALPGHDVPERFYMNPGNSARIPPGTEKTVCRIGERECCIFITSGPDGFACQKFSGGMAAHLTERKARGTMKATRIGDCALRGREEDRG